MPAPTPTNCRPNPLNAALTASTTGLRIGPRTSAKYKAAAAPATNNETTGAK